jgi:drug/metabolite transporter (DMT)-like permease
MIFILLSILFNAYVGVIFKYFGKWGINSQIAIVINYWVCVITGSLMLQENPFVAGNFTSDWFPWSLAIGVLLISMFNIMSVASVRIGVTLTQAANKMSLAIPVFFSFYLYHESLGIIKILGILTALLGVYFITRSSKTSDKQKSKNWWLLPILFIGSGSIDTIMKFVETNFISTSQSLNYYLIFCFGMAASIGTLFLITQLVMGRFKVNSRSLLAGIMLGIPNYFSIYFLIKALQFKDLNSSSIIPINNIGILIAVTIYGFIIFNEKLSSRNKIGLALAASSIILLILGS